MSRLFGALILAASLAACSTMEPAYQRPDAPVSPGFPTGAAYKDGGNPNFPPAAETGWRNFMTDARLQRLVEIALANNRDLRIAALNVREAQAQYRIQRAALFPQVSAFADASHSRSPESLRTPGGSNGSGGALITHQYEAGVSAAWDSTVASLYPSSLVPRPREKALGTSSAAPGTGAPSGSRCEGRSCRS